MALPGALVRGIGMVTAVGVGAKPTATSVTAGVARLEESGFLNRRLEPLVMGVLPESELAPAAQPVLEAPGLPATRLRLLRLAGPALKEAAADLGDARRVPVYLGTASPAPGRPIPADARWFELLSLQGGVPFDVGRSKAFASGRAAAFLAMQAALESIHSGELDYVFVGGVDSFVDPMRLARLDAEGRLLGSGVMDGFIPGEGAGFVLLSSTAVRGSAIALVRSAATGIEKGHRYSSEPYRGDGLADTFRSAFERAGDIPPVRTVWAGFNGENLNAKEWGTAFLRNRERFADPLRVEHPVDCFGDPGAALGALLVCLAAWSIAGNESESPALAWAPSDDEARGAALLTRTR